MRGKEGGGQRKEQRQRPEETRTSRGGDNRGKGPSTKIEGQTQKGESGDQMGSRAPGGLRDLAKICLTSYFQMLSAPSLPAGPTAALGQARRLTTRNLPCRTMGPRSCLLGLGFSVSRLGLLLLLPLLPGMKLNKPGLDSLGVAAVLVLPKSLSTCALFVSLFCAGEQAIRGVCTRGCMKG